MLDFSKPIRTRDGQAVRILCVDANCKTGDIVQPIVGIVANGVLAAWGENGAYMPGRDSPLDLVNVPLPKKKVRVEVRLCGKDGDIVADARILDSEDTFLLDSEDVRATGLVDIEYEVQP